MGGGLIQLVAYGAQDVYLTGNPQITFFKVVYRRHTNFAIESIEQSFNGTPDFGNRVTSTISRNGDLISNCILEVTLPKLCSTTAGVSSNYQDDVPSTETSWPVTLVDQAGTSRNDTVFIAAGDGSTSFQKKNLYFGKNLDGTSNSDTLNVAHNSNEIAIDTFNESETITVSKTGLLMVTLNSCLESYTTANDIRLGIKLEIKINGNTKYTNEILSEGEAPVFASDFHNLFIYHTEPVNTGDTVDYIVTVHNYSITEGDEIMINSGLPSQNHPDNHKEFIEVKTVILKNSSGGSSEVSSKGAISRAISNGHARWVQYLGHYLINSVEVEIGGQMIDRHYGHWLQVWFELSRNCCKDFSYNRMIGNVTELTDPGSLIKLQEEVPHYPIHTSSGDACILDSTGIKIGEKPHSKKPETLGCTPEYTLYVPLQFWFNRNPGLALPLIALQYHEVNISFSFDTIDNLTLGKLKTNCCRSMKACSLYVDYIYLDTDERRRFAQVSHEYLIEQLQFTGNETITLENSKVSLNFNHPIKEIIWTCSTNQKSPIKTYNYRHDSDTPWEIDYSAPKVYSNFTTNSLAASEGSNPVSSAKLQLNGHDRFSERKGSYFNLVQPWQHHTTSPSIGVNVYSFAIKPEEHQPSGSCNFSRIDNAILILTMNGIDDSNISVNASKTVDYVLRIYAINYNVLRIMSGMCGLAYSN
jgi:hypothetical protein